MRRIFVTWADKLCDLWQIFDFSILPQIDDNYVYNCTALLILMMMAVNVMTMIYSDDEKPGCSKNKVLP